MPEVMRKKVVVFENEDGTQTHMVADVFEHEPPDLDAYQAFVTEEGKLQKVMTVGNPQEEINTISEDARTYIEDVIKAHFGGRTITDCFFSLTPVVPEPETESPA